MIKQENYKAVSYKEYDVPNPGGGGLNIQDLPFNQLSNQSPTMLNMIQKNGAFGKRYGQSIYESFDETIYRLGYFKGEVIVHSGTKLYKYDSATKTKTEIYSGCAEKGGLFINYNKCLYYLTSSYLCYDGEECKAVEPFCPDICINRKPDGSYSDLVEDYNRLGAGFKNTFNGDGSSREYYLTLKDLDSTAVTAEVGTTEYTEGTQFTVDRENGKVTFTTAPEKGQNNVVITAYKTDQKYVDSIMGCKYSANYGGNNNSRLFLAGNGNAVYYFSDTFDASYFPESNYAALGNGEYDITGFGGQYNIMVVFKENEMYAITYYMIDDSSSEYNGEMRFSSTMINDHIGCDAPESIQLVNNKLTWVNSTYGVCTMVSTTLQDERNVQFISRNVNGGYRENGLLQEPKIKEAKTVNWEGKYMIAIDNVCYVWDYLNTPYTVTSDPDLDAKKIAWFKWTNFEVGDWLIDDKLCFYSRGKNLVTLGNNLDDFGEAIESYYQTPLFQFDMIEYLKTVKNMYVLVRGDTPARIKIRYITDENPNGEPESEDIVNFTHLWDTFAWNTFGWLVIPFGKTFARKCSMKKIQMFGIYFENEEVDRDMSISAIKLSYLPVKKVK